MQNHHIENLSGTSWSKKEHEYFISLLVEAYETKKEFPIQAIAKALNRSEGAIIRRLYNSGFGYSGGVIYRGPVKRKMQRRNKTVAEAQRQEQTAPLIEKQPLNTETNPIRMAISYLRESGLRGTITLSLGE